MAIGKEEVWTSKGVGTKNAKKHMVTHAEPPQARAA